MEMTKISAGKLHAIGYDTKTRILRVELDGGNALEYSNISEDLWRRFKNSGSQWSFYRDNIEEELTAKQALAKSVSGGKNPLDDLFK
jgi:hypothetical protein